MILSIEAARQLVEQCMRVHGHTAEEAAIIADHLIDCELRGLSFGGLPRALSVIDNLRVTTIPRRPITVLQESPASAQLDGGNQVGYLVGRRATEIAIDKARQTGIAVVGASKTWYTGMFSYYLEMATQAGFVGMAAGGGSPKVAPHGGTQGRYSTNPIAFGFPSTPSPIIWDIGTSSVMVGEVVLKKRLGQQLAPGQAYDRAGQPTLDPAEALTGAFTGWGGHKGSGLAMMVQMLAMMAGQVAAPHGMDDCGFLILLINPGLFGSAADFEERISAYAQSMRATRPVNPAEPVRVPFDRSVAERTRRTAQNRIDVPDGIHAALQDIAAGH